MLTRKGFFFVTSKLSLVNWHTTWASVNPFYWLLSKAQVQKTKLSTIWIITIVVGAHKNDIGVGHFHFRINLWTSYESVDKAGKIVSVCMCHTHTHYVYGIDIVYLLRSDVIKKIVFLSNFSLNFSQCDKTWSTRPGPKCSFAIHSTRSFIFGVWNTSHCLNMLNQNQRSRCQNNEFKQFKHKKATLGALSQTIEQAKQPIFD